MNLPHLPTSANFHQDIILHIQEVHQWRVRDVYKRQIEKTADAQLGRSFEFSLPKEWNRKEQIEYTTDYIQDVYKRQDHGYATSLDMTVYSWKEDIENGNIVVDESHPDWWQDKKNPDRHGIRIPRCV